MKPTSFLGIISIFIGLVFLALSPPDSATEDESASSPSPVTTKNEVIDGDTSNISQKMTDVYSLTRIIDGDTIEAKEAGIIRLIGIDAPEISSKGGKSECYGRMATDFLAKLLTGERIRLERDTEDRDRYGRLLRYVYLSDGTLVNMVMVKEGYAQVLTIPPNIRYALTFLAAQREARQARTGLWSASACLNSMTSL